MAFIRRDLPAIIVFVVICCLFLLVGDYLFPEKLKIGGKAFPILFCLVLFAVALSIRMQCKKWIPSRKDWKDLTKSIK